MELLKQRLLGAVVLFSLAIIFLPDIFDEKGMSVFLAENSAGETLPYQQVLAQHSSEIRAYKGSAIPKDANTKAWSVRVAAFSDPSVASHLEEKLRMEGYTTYTQSADGNLYHVLVGPELAVSNAHVVQERLEEHLDLDGVVVPYDPVLYVQNDLINQG